MKVKFPLFKVASSNLTNTFFAVHCPRTAILTAECQQVVELAKFVFEDGEKEALKRVNAPDGYQRVATILCGNGSQLVGGGDAVVQRILNGEIDMEFITYSVNGETIIEPVFPNQTA